MSRAQTGGQQCARRRLISKFGEKCAVCGHEGYVELHHIKAAVDGGDCSDDNLVLLCYPCHQKAHGNTIRKAASFVSAYEGRN